MAPRNKTRFDGPKASAPGAKVIGDAASQGGTAMTVGGDAAPPTVGDVPDLGVESSSLLTVESRRLKERDGIVARLEALGFEKGKNQSIGLSLEFAFGNRAKDEISFCYADDPGANEYCYLAWISDAKGRRTGEATDQIEAPALDEPSVRALMESIEGWMKRRRGPKPVSSAVKASPEPRVEDAPRWRTPGTFHLEDVEWVSVCADFYDAGYCMKSGDRVLGEIFYVEGTTPRGLLWRHKASFDSVDSSALARAKALAARIGAHLEGGGKLDPEHWTKHRWNFDPVDVRYWAIPS